MPTVTMLHCARNREVYSVRVSANGHESEALGGLVIDATIEIAIEIEREWLDGRLLWSVGGVAKRQCRIVSVEPCDVLDLRDLLKSRERDLTAELIDLLEEQAAEAVACR
jgi:hypothetical protein